MGSGRFDNTELYTPNIYTELYTPNYIRIYMQCIIMHVGLIHDGFNLHKQAFRDALCLRFGWTPARLATHCPCGQPFSVSHAFSCPKGAMPSIRHNAVRDITAQLLTVCPKVGVEPTLQTLNGESFPFRSTNTEDGARLDIKAQKFWDKSKQPTFFDVRIFNSLATSNCTSSSDACYRRHEREKRRAYEQRILEVEHGTFTPLVLSTSGG